MAVTFQNARKVELPKINRVSKDIQLVTDLLPYVEGARDENAGITLDTNDAQGLRRALRKAGRALPDGAVTVRFSADSAQKGEGSVTFWTSKLVVRKPKGEQAPAEQSPAERPTARRGKK